MIRLMFVMLTATVSIHADDTFEALTCGSCPVIVLDSDYGAAYEQYKQTDNADSTVWDAREAQWRFSNFPLLQAYPIDIRVATGGTWCGGTVLGTMDTLETWEALYDRATGGSNGAALIVGKDGDASGFTVDGLRLHNVWDGIRPEPGADNFRIANCWFSDIRDDAVENDQYKTGTIDDCMFDGVFMGISCRDGNSGGMDGSGDTVTVQNCLIRLKAFPIYRDETENYHQSFFKFQPLSPYVIIKNCVFAAEGVPYMGTKGLQFPQQYTDKLLVSENNTIVWLGSGDFPAPVQPGFTVTTDRSVWDDAKTAWINAHPEVPRFAWDPASDTSAAVRAAGINAPLSEGVEAGVLYNLRGEAVSGISALPAGIYLKAVEDKLIRTVITR